MLEDSFSFAIVNGRFPRIGHILQEQWDDPAFASCMEALLHHDSHRQGFPREVECALYSLAIEHDVEFPNLTNADRDF
jgi:hypothetical protein